MGARSSTLPHALPADLKKIAKATTDAKAWVGQKADAAKLWVDKKADAAKAWMKKKKDAFVRGFNKKV